MWKYLKGTEEDFEQTLPETQCVLQPKFSGYPFYYTVISNVLFYSEPNSMFWCNSVHKNITKALEGEDAIIIAQREWIEEPHIETKPEEQQTLPTKEDINVTDAMEQSSTPSIGSMMNPAKDLPKIKLDVKKPIFDKGDDKEVKFIYSNNIYSVFELTDGDIFCIEISKVDTYFYNKPDVKTTEQLISDAWTCACNDGSLWASPTQLYYIAIKELIKHNVIDVSKTHEVPDDTTK